MATFASMADPLCSSTELSVSELMMLRKLAGSLAISCSRMSQTMPEMSCPQACDSLPHDEQLVDENWQVLSAVRSALLHWFLKKPRPRRGSSAISAATVSAMPSPYSP